MASLNAQVAKLEAENKELADSTPTAGTAANLLLRMVMPILPRPKSHLVRPRVLTRKMTNPRKACGSGLKPGGRKATKAHLAEPERTQYHPVIDCEKCHRSLRSKEPVKLVERQVFEPGRFGQPMLQKLKNATVVMLRLPVSRNPIGMAQLPALALFGKLRPDIFGLYVVVTRAQRKVFINISLNPLHYLWAM